MVRKSAQKAWKHGKMLKGVGGIKETIQGRGGG